MINYSFHLIFYTTVFFLLGMYRPNWALFFMKKPDRILVSVFTLVLVMIAFTMYGEGTRQKKLAETKAQNAAAPANIDAPVPVPVPATPAAPK